MSEFNSGGGVGKLTEVQIPYESGWKPNLPLTLKHLKCNISLHNMPGGALDLHVNVYLV